MSYVFTRYSSILFVVVGIAPNKETFVSVTNALFWMIWLVVWHLCCSNALFVLGWQVVQLSHKLKLLQHTRASAYA